jgi:hypothetical protein
VSHTNTPPDNISRAGSPRPAATAPPHNTGPRRYRNRLDNTNITLVTRRPIWTPDGLVADVIREEYNDHDDSVDVIPLGRVVLTDLRSRDSVAKYLMSLDPQKEHQVNWHREVARCFASVAQQEQALIKPVLLPDVDPREDDLFFNLDGWPLLTRHHSILFGDGDSCKSYLALWVAGRMAQAGRRVLVLDWELDAPDHRERLERLFGEDMPRVHYLRVNGPLNESVEHIQTCCQRSKIDYLILDSVGFAVSGQPETSEAALGYFAALKDIGVPGTLSLAHITKATPKAQRGREKPFGSNFWHQAARATWLIAARTPKAGQVEAVISCRKSNMAARPADVRMSVQFRDSDTAIALSGGAWDKSLGQPLKKRLVSTLNELGTCDRDTFYALLPNDNPETIRKALLRNTGILFIEENGLFSLLPDVAA